MAYVEWHSEIRKHDKTDDLMRRLKITRREAVGIIGCISSWAIGHEPGGIFDRSKIAIAVEWEKDPQELLKALLGAGWLNEFDKNRVEIHDWEDITAGYRRARKDAKRKKDRRAAEAKKASKKSSGRPKVVRGQVEDKPSASRPEDVRGLSAGRRAEQNDRNDRNEQQQQSNGVSTSHVAPSKPASRKRKGATSAGTGDDRGIAVVVPEGKESRDPLLNQVNFTRSMRLLLDIEMAEPIAISLAKIHPVGQIFDAVEASRGADSRAGYVRQGFDEGWKFKPANGPALAQLVEHLKTDHIVAGDRLEKRAGTLGITTPARARLEGESEDDWLRRIQAEKRKAD